MSPPARTTPRRSTPGHKITSAEHTESAEIFMAITTYTHLQQARNCALRVASRVARRPACEQTISPGAIKLKSPSRALGHHLTRIRPHLQQLHPLSTCAVKPGTGFVSRGKASYNTYRPLNPFIPPKRVSFLPLNAKNKRIICAFSPTSQVFTLSLTHLQSLTGTYNPAPQATHALTPLFKGGSAREGGIS